MGSVREDLPKEIDSILFICYGNICRSPMAERIAARMLRSRGNTAMKLGSAGLHALNGNQSPAEAAKAMSEVGLDITDHRARLVLPGMDEEYSLIVLMDRYNLREFLTLFPQAEAKARLMRAFAGNGKKQDVEDPYGGPVEAYRQCRETLTEALSGFFGFLERMR